MAGPAASATRAECAAKTAAGDVPAFFSSGVGVARTMPESTAKRSRKMFQPVYVQPMKSCALSLRILRRARAPAMLAVSVLACPSVLGQSEESLLDDFLAVASVFTHPRCANCHAPGDAPLQGAEQRPHSMQVRRGADGLGWVGARCESCHAASASGWPNSPPAVPGWRMPSEELPMVFAGKRPGELCRQLKDPEQTGRSGLGEALEHTLEDPLIEWAFAPGPGREPPPLDRAAFFERLARWATNGATCPP